MELIEIIKQTIFLIILFGFGIFSLSYSIYKIKTRKKSEAVLAPVPAVKRKPLNNLPVQKQVDIIYQGSIHRKTAERFIVLNDLSTSNTQKDTLRNKTTNTYQLNSIRNTGMFTLKFE
jgi:hypothetical protein